MRFFERLRTAKKSTILTIIDVGSASIGAAYVEYKPNDTPTIHYTLRVPIALSANESAAGTMERTLAQVAEKLIGEGAPALARAVGHAQSEKIVVSVAAPWQETLVSVKTIEPGHSFIFTHAIMHSAVEENTQVKEGRKATDTSIIATLLNGYETHKPFGKRATRAGLVLLSSTIETTIAESITRTLEKAFHTHDIELRAFLPACYTVLRDLYPHEEDFFILDVSGEATDIALIKRGLMVGAHTFPAGTRSFMDAAHTSGAHELATTDAIQSLSTQPSKNVDTARTAWLSALSKTLQAFLDRYALARTVFILTDETARDFIRETLDQPSLRTLWLSDEPLRLLPVQPAYFANRVRTRGSAEGDIFIALLSLYYAKSLGA